MTTNHQIIRVAHRIHIPFQLTTDVEHGDGEAVEFTYCDGRVKYFLESQMPMKAPIGKQTINIFPIIHGRRPDSSFSPMKKTGDLISYYDADVHLLWSLDNEQQWHEIRMSPKLSASLPRAGLSGRTISYYFRIHGRLNAIREKAVFSPHPHPETYYGNFETEVKDAYYYYVEGYRLADQTVYDNPGGPYTNYQLKL